MFGVYINIGLFTYIHTTTLFRGPAYPVSCVIFSRIENMKDCGNKRNLKRLAMALCKLLCAVFIDRKIAH